MFKTLVALQRIKMSQYFPKPYDHLVEILTLKYDTDKSELENKIPDTSGLVKKNRLLF